MLLCESTLKYMINGGIELVIQHLVSVSLFLRLNCAIGVGSEIRLNLVARDTLSCCWLGDQAMNLIIPVT